MEKIPEITPRERRKYEAAQQLGLMEKLLEGGWGALTARENGLIGALAAGRSVTQEKD
ncbi:MAG: small, acid-soluble spore protein, alpha/beta type [Clostridia bacterium]|nr:small, acid-soluble spore protein, alpha/beta type [Clostridia bacterium]MBQ4086248.1 small, acid-soluble spore protein, alpha/beta type [Clostridia bacterium]